MRCDFCNEIQTRHIARRTDGREVVACLRCGLGRLKSMPRKEEIEQFYGVPEYYEGNGASSYKEYFELQRRSFRDVHSKWTRRLNLIEFFLNKEEREAPIKILDIGCAAGFFLKLAEEKGWESYGIDCSEYALAYARDKLNLQVYAGQFPNVEWIKPLKFDVITMWDFIEHVPSPLATLRKTKMLLNPGGVLGISTPNLKRAKLYGNHWLGFKTSFEHLYYFTPAVLTGMLENLGFTILQVRTESYYGLLPAQTLLWLQRQRDKNVLRIIRKPSKNLLALLRYLYHFVPNRLSYGHVLVVYARAEK